MYVATYVTPSQIIRNASSKGEKKTGWRILPIMYVATYAMPSQIIRNASNKSEKKLDDGCFR